MRSGVYGMSWEPWPPARYTSARAAWRPQNLDDGAMKKLLVGAADFGCRRDPSGADKTEIPVKIPSWTRTPVGRSTALSIDSEDVEREEAEIEIERIFLRRIISKHAKVWVDFADDTSDRDLVGCLKDLIGLCEESDRDKRVRTDDDPVRLGGTAGPVKPPTF